MLSFWFCFVVLVPTAWTQTFPVPVVGVQAGVNSVTGQRPARLNINDLYTRGGPQWDLYIQALTEFQEAPEADERSYFQISGIHGIPIASWNGAEQVPGGINGGYCPHNEQLFATWHRPYVALFEQVLVSHAQTIAARYRGRNGPRYLKAAQTLRQPYWDWAADPNLPVAVTRQQLNITGPYGLLTVRNPLYSYRWQRKENETGFENTSLSIYTETVRCPLPNGADDDFDIANSNLEAPSLALASQTYDVFARASTFERMASMSSQGPSFEMPHNTIHNYAGCENGTLADVGWSAFDPVFMLHHSNVDRLIAMWQAVYYNESTMSSTTPTTGAFGSTRGDASPDTPLKPFFLDTNGTFHTSRTAAQTKTFGYTYPEINDWSRTQDELRDFVINRVNVLYGGGTANIPKQTVRAFIKGRGPVSPSIAYTAEVQVDRSEVPLPCSIDVRMEDHLLASVSLLGMPLSGMAYSSVPLRDSLQHLSLKDMPEDTLIPYLQKNLRGEVRKRDGTVLSRNQVPSLKLELQGQEFHPPMSNFTLPKYGTARRYPVSKRI